MEKDKQLISALSREVEETDEQIKSLLRKRYHCVELFKIYGEEVPEINGEVDNIPQLDSPEKETEKCECGRDKKHRGRCWARRKKKQAVDKPNRCNRCDRPFVATSMRWENRNGIFYHFCDDLTPDDPFESYGVGVR